MTTILFWNLNKKPHDKIIADLVAEHEVDILVISESPFDPKALANKLSQSTTSRFRYPFGLCEKVHVLTRFPNRFVETEFEARRYTIRRVMLPAREEFLLVGVHLSSKLFFSSESQSFECVGLSESIRAVERKVGHTRTLVVGDLNMNPFEAGVIAASGLNAVMTKDIALRGVRTVQDKQYSFFYNPMWGRFGDNPDRPPGTHYYDRAEHTTLYWHMFDQVLIRPDLIPFFRDEDLKILTRCGDTSFLSRRGLPDRSAVSDHLPIVFKLNH